MSFSKPYQKSGSKTVHRSSRKAKFSATVGFLNPERLRKSKESPDVSGLSGQVPQPTEIREIP